MAVEEYNNVSLEELIKMASKKDVDAQAELGRRYSVEGSEIRNVKTAIEWAEKAYARGRTDMVVLLGRLCLECADVSDEYAQKAIKYYTAGAQADITECLCKLAELYRDGLYSLAKAPEKSFELLLKAVYSGVGSDKDELYAKYMLGNAYFEGIGTNKDNAKAISCYLEAAKKGYDAAYIKLAECCISIERADEAELYAKKACDSSDKLISEKGKALYASCIAMKEAYTLVNPDDINAELLAKNSKMAARLTALHNATDSFNGFEAEANRLIHNAETFERIGNIKKIYPAYERAADEYPADFRGWYNLARIYTDNFAAYSLFEANGYGKLEDIGFGENMMYAEKTVSDTFMLSVAEIKKAYTEDIIDISVTWLKNALYGFYTESSGADVVADFARKYEDKLIYLYKKRPCVVTALSLHLLENVLENDNIRKYNEQASAHNRAIEAKIGQRVQDYITELAQNLRIDNPKDYASNAEALEAVNSDDEYIDMVEQYRQKLRSEQEYYTELDNAVRYDKYDEQNFGKGKEYEGWKPMLISEFDDEYVDFIILLANRCGIQLRDYDAFYTEERRTALNDKVSIIEKASDLQIQYHERFISVAKKYAQLEPTGDEMLASLTRALVNYGIAYSQYAKANSSNVFKQVFKGKEIKETREDTTAAFEAAQGNVDSAAKTILLSARKEMSELNEEFRASFVDEAHYMAFYGEACLDDAIRARVALMKSQHEQL